MVEFLATLIVLNFSTKKIASPFWRRREHDTDLAVHDA